MAGLDVSHLSPDDAVAALRSFPRRFRAALAAAEDDDVEELAHRVGPAGTSAVDHLVDATSALMLLGRALHQVVRSQEPLLHPAVLDPTLRQWDPPPGLDVATLVDLLGDEVDDLVAEIAHVGSPDWARTGRVADGAEITALDVVREAVRTVAEDLRGVESAMAAAR